MRRASVPYRKHVSTSRRDVPLPPAAPAAIPATIEVTFPVGFAPVDGTGSPVIFTLSATNSDRPARSANAITGTNPAHDTRFSSSNRTAARDHLCNNLTESAFRLHAIRELQQPSSSQVRRHFPHQRAAPNRSFVGGFRLRAVRGSGSRRVIAPHPHA